jgi:NADH-quinone oxidoreductase subunit E
VTEILLNVLRKYQEKNGYLSEEVLKEISTKYNVPISRLYGLATFYTQLHTKPVGKYVIELCGSPSCQLNNSREIEHFLETHLNIEIGQTTEDKLFTLKKTSCIGCCNEAPAMLINGEPHTKLTIERVKYILEKLKNANS